MAEWGNVRVSKAIMELASKVVEQSEEGYRNNADLIHSLIRQKYRETIKRAAESKPTIPPFLNGCSEEQEIETVLVTEGNKRTVYLLDNQGENHG